MRITTLLAALLLAIVLPCRAEPDAGTKLATAIYLTVAAENATSPTLSFGDSAERFYDGMMQTALAAPDIPVEQKVALVAVVGSVRASSNTPEAAEAAAGRLVALLQGGTWDDAGVPSAVLGNPTPELRQKLMQELDNYADDRARFALAALAAAFN